MLTQKKKIVSILFLFLLFIIPQLFSSAVGDWKNWEINGFPLSITQAGIKTGAVGLAAFLGSKKQYTGLPSKMAVSLPLLYRVGLNTKEDVFVTTGIAYGDTVGKHNKMPAFLTDPVFGLTQKFSIKNLNFIGRASFKLPLFSPDYSINNGALELRTRVLMLKKQFYFGPGIDFRFNNNDNINYGEILYFLVGMRKQLNPRMILFASANLDYVLAAKYTGEADRLPAGFTEVSRSVLHAGIISDFIYNFNSVSYIKTTLVLNSSKIELKTLYTYSGLRLF